MSANPQERPQQKRPEHHDGGRDKQIEMIDRHPGNAESRHQRQNERIGGNEEHEPIPINDPEIFASQGDDCVHVDASARTAQDSAKAAKTNN